MIKKRPKLKVTGLMHKILFYTLIFLFYSSKGVGQTVSVYGFKDKKLTPLEVNTKFKGLWETNEEGQDEYSPSLILNLATGKDIEFAKGKYSKIKIKKDSLLIKLQHYKDIIQIKPAFNGYDQLAIKLSYPQPVIDENCEALNLRMILISKTPPPFFIGLSCNQTGELLKYTFSTVTGVTESKTPPPLQASEDPPKKSRIITYVFDFGKITPIEFMGKSIPNPKHTLATHSFKYKNKTYTYDFIYEDKQITQAMNQKDQAEKEQKLKELEEEKKEKQTEVLLGFGNASYVIESNSSRINDEPLNFFIHYTYKDAFWGMDLGFQFWNGLTSSGGYYDVKYKEVKPFLGFTVFDGSSYFAKLRAYGIYATISEDTLPNGLNYAQGGLSLLQGFSFGQNLIEVDIIGTSKHYSATVYYTYRFKESGFDLGGLWSLQRFSQLDTSNNETLYTQNFLNVFMRF
ncbi:MAG: hypothetical protein KDD50_04295 [Bdellovibrionales bacterium]|nr:hypothetical protein [Bdellovibrionales bacterium]